MRIFMRFFRGGKYYKKYKITFLKDSLQICYLCYHLYIRRINAHLHLFQNVKFKCNNKILQKAGLVFIKNVRLKATLRQLFAK